MLSTVARTSVRQSAAVRSFAFVPSPWGSDTWRYDKHSFLAWCTEATAKKDSAACRELYGMLAMRFGDVDVDKDGKINAAEFPTLHAVRVSTLVQGSNDYYTTAMTKLFTHPWHINNSASFELEYEYRFANMCTSKCGGLEPNADRRKPLTETCTDNDVDWLQVWKELSDDDYTTAMTKLLTHPWHTNDNATFERENECWFATMCTNKCGGLEPNADRRKPFTEKCIVNDVDWLQVWKEFSDRRKPLTEKCTDNDVDSLQVWKEFSDEIQYFKKEYLSARVREEDEGVKCGGLESNVDRKKPLTEKCTDNDVGWLQVWKEFSDRRKPLTEKCTDNDVDRLQVWQGFSDDH